MTETQFLASADPAAMLALITNDGSGPGAGPNRVPLSDRKLRLFSAAAGCKKCETLFSGLPPLDCARHVAGADCRTMAKKAAILRDIVGNPWRPVTLPPGPSVKCGACGGVGWRYPIPPKWDAEAAKQNRALPTRRSRKNYPHLEAECPFCRGTGSVPGPYLWLTPAVASLARAAVEERGRKCEACNGSGGEDEDTGGVEPWGASISEWRNCDACRGTGRIDDGSLDPQRLAVLSDALEAAGCVEETLLRHLRSPGPHVIGCWCLDLLLEK